MPYYKKLTDNTTGQSYTNALSIGVRQAIRNGRQQGQLLEDIGAVTEYIVRPRLTDLLPGSTEDSQFDRIADQLKTLGVRTGLNNLHFVCESIDYNTTSSDVTIDVQVKGINQPSIIDDTGKSLSVAKFKSNIKSQHSFKLASMITILVILRHGVKWVFNGTSKSVGVYNWPSTKKSQGWNSVVVNGLLVTEYNTVPGIVTEIRSYYTAPVGSNITIEIDVALESQMYGDFLSLYITDADDNVESLLNTVDPYTNMPTEGVSGVKTVAEKYAVTTKTEQFFVNIIFNSDLAVQMKGATISVECCHELK
ncbi:hypothetical protein O5D80_001358 [Batrachochytrium dendrobatidis]|nr:hypothetical protein O5D80_001358 [Batrachochytrium dendrobatidis]